MTDFVISDGGGLQPVIPEGYGIPVGPNPDGPAQPEAMTLYVEMTLSGGTRQTHKFEIPATSHVTRMQLTAKRGEKDLGPILVTNFAFHDDSRQLHTICRRDSEIIDEMEY